MTEVLDKATHEPPRPTTAELVQRAIDQLSRLIRDELALARAELRFKAKRAASGAGLFSGAALFGFFAVGCLVTAAVLALALVLPGWAAALIVAGGLLLIALILALVGRSNVKRASQPLPQEAMDGLKADIAEVRRALNR
ncbi:putative superfamily III holin-X [Stackebrandtia endophytica]|uniref:Putative superfamily III holin-X n=1 Tax=Stackebrandtia endophytica TaxID=1496996 RepID=A0A543AQD2_9ACTN|nr:phage holin family protein [Stackebrandtia endophytica]TQL74769.1 putative superfamily III holin-X [Stackebrandtia endophytica]